MAFELIFGSGTVPGSDEVCRQLMQLRERADVAKFCHEVRLRVAGGNEAVKERQSRKSTLIEEGRAAKKACRFDEAFSKFTEAANIFAAFDVELLKETIELLEEMKMLEEALALSYLGKSYYRWNPKKWFNEKMTSLFRQVGYTAGSLVVSPGADRQQMVIELVEKFDRSSTYSTFKSAFFLVNAILHVGAWGEKGDKFKNRKFSQAIDRNDKIVSFLKDPPNLSTITVDDLHLLVLLMRLLNAMKPKKAKAPLIDENRDLFYDITKSVGNLIASPETLARMATSEVGAFNPLVKEFFEFSFSAFNEAFFNDRPPEFLKPPYDSFQWYNHIFVMPIFSGTKFDELVEAKEKSLYYDITFLRERVPLLIRRQAGDALLYKAEKLTDDELGKPFDLWLLITAVAFAEWRLALTVDEDGDNESHYNEFDQTLVDMSTIWGSFQLLYEVIGNLEEGNANNELIVKCYFGNKYLFRYLAVQLLFMAQHLENIEPEMGDEQFSETARLLFRLIRSHLASVDVARSLAEWDDFTEPFVEAAKVFFTNRLANVQQLKESGFIAECLGRLCSVSSNFLAKFARPLEEAFFTGLYNPCFSNPLLFAILLRNADEQTCGRLAKYSNMKLFGYQFRNFVLDITRDKSIDISTHANSLLVFAALIGRPSSSSPILKFNAIPWEPGFLKQKIFFLKLVSTITGDTLQAKTQQRIGSNSRKRTTSLVMSDDRSEKIYNLVTSIAASSILATICEIDVRFKKMLRQSASRHEIVNKLRHQIDQVNEIFSSSSS